MPKGNMSLTISMKRCIVEIHLIVHMWITSLQSRMIKNNKRKQQKVSLVKIKTGSANDYTCRAFFF